MLRLLPSLAVLALLVSPSRLSAKDFPMPERLSPCPAYVKLDCAKMEDVDGRKEKTVRRRPWPDETGKIEHSDLVLENLRLHHFCDNKAIMINTGSPDKPRVSGQVASYKSVTLRNLDIGLVCREKPGLHMDFIWIGGGHDAAIRPDVTLEDIFIHEGNTGVMPVLFEAGGNWGTLTLRRVAMANVVPPIMIKMGKSSFKEIVIEDCPQVRVAFQGEGEPVTVRVRGCSGADIQTPKDAKGQRAQNVKIVYEDRPTTQPVAAAKAAPTTQPAQ